MTKQGDQTPSQFNARADNAALALRGHLQQQGRQVAPNAPVEVGPDGKPPAALPPEGSYARNAIESAKAAQQGQPTEQQVVGDQPQAGTTQQVMDGSMAPKLPPEGQPQQTQEEPSPRAERRIKELIDQLRQKDSELARIQADSQSSQQQMQEQLAQLQQQHQQMLQANLEQLDPETRMQVMQDARLHEMFAGLEQRIMSRLQPQLKDLETRDARREMAELADSYPAFDLQIHGPLIDQFRAKNSHCTIEQAFRAIATSEELVTRETASAQAVPPVVPPGSGVAQGVRYAPQPEGQSDPAQEIADEQSRFEKLRRSNDPNEQKQGLDLVHSLLAKKLSR